MPATTISQLMLTFLTMKFSDFTNLSTWAYSIKNSGFIFGLAYSRIANIEPYWMRLDFQKSTHIRTMEFLWRQNLQQPLYWGLNVVGISVMVFRCVLNFAVANFNPIFSLIQWSRLGICPNWTSPKHWSSPTHSSKSPTTQGRILSAANTFESVGCWEEMKLGPC